MPSLFAVADVSKGLFIQRKNKNDSNFKILYIENCMLQGLCFDGTFANRNSLDYAWFCDIEDVVPNFYVIPQQEMLVERMG